MHHLADELGVTDTAVRLWEVGERQPSPALLARYVALLDDLRAAAPALDVDGAA